MRRKERNKVRRKVRRNVGTKVRRKVRRNVILLTLHHSGIHLFPVSRTCTEGGVASAKYKWWHLFDPKIASSILRWGEWCWDKNKSWSELGP